MYSGRKTIALCPYCENECELYEYFDEDGHDEYYEAVICKHCEKTYGARIIILMQAETFKLEDIEDAA